MSSRLTNELPWRRGRVAWGVVGINHLRVAAASGSVAVARLRRASEASTKK